MARGQAPPTPWLPPANTSPIPGPSPEAIQHPVPTGNPHAPGADSPDQPASTPSGTPPLASDPVGPSQWIGGGGEE